MKEAGAGVRAAERLLAEKEVLARALTTGVYAELPDLVERHGEYGRKKCLEDMHYNLEHLAPAVSLGDPSLFEGYVRWLDGLLRARNVQTRDIIVTLQVMERTIGERFPADEAAAVIASIRAGLAVLEGSGES